MNTFFMNTPKTIRKGITLITINSFEPVCLALFYRSYSHDEFNLTF
jgi:hypothetical protein